MTRMLLDSTELRIELGRFERLTNAYYARRTGIDAVCATVRISIRFGFYAFRSFAKATIPLAAAMTKKRTAPSRKVR